MSEEIKNPDDGGDLKQENSEKKIEDKKSPEELPEIKTGKPIVIRAEAYKTIILYASRYANRSIPPENWKEIYGILIGHSDEELVYIERAEALTFGHATDVQLDQNKIEVLVSSVFPLVSYSSMTGPCSPRDRY